MKLATHIGLLAIGLTGIIGLKSGVTDQCSIVDEPDRFAWQVFTEISKPSTVDPKLATWETWALQQDLFPLKPTKENPPKWPAGSLNQRLKRFEPITKLQELQRMFLRSPTLQSQFRLSDKQHNLFFVPGPAGGQEVRVNKDAFDFIVGNHLYYREGQEELFNNGGSINFPKPAKEIKAVWRLLKSGEDVTHFHSASVGGKTFVLIALHITTKDLPNWFWATWEHVDNPGRNKVLEVHDSFGFPQGSVSPGLQALFSEAKMPPEWQYYRLDGVQTQFTDSLGRPTLSGNSEIEKGFESTSSCITCHARSAVDGQFNQPEFFRSPDFGVNAPGTIAGYTGAPDPSWFFTNTLSRGEQRLYMQRDFVWALMRARPLSASGLAETAPTPLSFDADIKRLFRASDIACMAPHKVFLDSYDYMSKPENAQKVLSRLKDGSMPEDGPWPPEQIAKFEQWILDGLRK